jgi:excinuclease ABC subunit A
MKKIIIKGAREHNLKNIDLELPRDKLIVISGLSGSGKSSLAFDTIFAEGQRRYVESLSSYARQFLGRLDKPDLDYIEGLSPAISIEQKTTHRNPRSTVGTVTEIYDYLRLLYARIGTAHCPECGRIIEEQSVDSIIDTILSLPKNARISLLAPIIKGKKGEHEKIFNDAKLLGIKGLRVNGKIIKDFDNHPALSKTKKHTIEGLISQQKIDHDQRQRLADSVESALEIGEGKLIVIIHEKSGDREEFFSQVNACPECGISIPELQPRIFSFNNPFGACPKCSGIGVTLDFSEDLVIPDKSLSFNQRAIIPYNPDANWYKTQFEALARHYNFSLDTPINELPRKVIDVILNGSDQYIDFKYVSKHRAGKWEYSSKFRGVLKELKRRYMETTSDGIKKWLENFMSQDVCPECGGKRLRKESLAVRVGDKNIFELTSFSIKEGLEFIESLELSETQLKISRQIIKEIKARFTFLLSVGLEYLTLERKASTLSGGEAQRIRLATQIGSSLVGVLYILDEPTIGLHQRDNQRLLDTLTHLRDIGNTLIVVEHDEQTLKTADHIVDLGPGAGVHGGYVIASGSYDEILKNKKSITGRFLSGAIRMDKVEKRRDGNGDYIEVIGAEEHNLKKIDVKFPLGTLILITGVSGSGKSSLLTDLLYPAIANKINRTNRIEGKYNKIAGVEHLDKIINVDQSPIGRTPRSNPATYVGVFNHIRDLFAMLKESKERGYKPGRFSFNVKGGRCENCQGDGTIKIEMHFLPDVYIQCDQCKGKRYNQETLNIRYKGKNIHDVLEMTVEEAMEFFSKIPKIHKKLNTLYSVGLGYIKLGQSAVTLSGGEAQRVKLSLELSKRSTGNTFYILDEPTTGLHFADVKMLMQVLHRLVDNGNTVVLIEHNLDVIAQADFIIDLGPEGGDKGGELVFQGSPEQLIKCRKSYTGRYLKAHLEDNK